MRRLLFIYNADSGLGNALLDAAHKVLKPATYDCQLCALTYGTFREKRDWKAFREGSNVIMEFLHKDEFLKMYSSKFLPAYSFPVVLEATDHDLEIFISTTRLNALHSTTDLIREVNSGLGKG